MRVKRKLGSSIYSSVPELTDAVVQAWDEVGEERESLQGLTSSMPRRLNAVMAAQGGPTLY